MPRTPTPEQIAEIARLNDQARNAMFFYAYVVESVGFWALPFDDRQRVRALVETYDAWDNATRFLGERDFGRIYQRNDGAWTTDKLAKADTQNVVVWNIDYYTNRQFKVVSSMPWNPDTTERVLLIRLENEY